MLDLLGDLLGPVVRRGQIIKWAAGEIWEGAEGKAMTARSERSTIPDNKNGRIQIKCIAEPTIQ